MDGDEVGDPDQAVDVHAGRALSSELLRLQVRIVSDDVHLECLAQLADTAADAAEAHDAQGLSAELSSHELVLIPVVVDLDIVVCGDGVSGDLQHLCDGQLGDRVRVHAGSVEDLDAFFLRVVHVDVVGTDCADTDHLQVLRRVEDLLVDLRVHTHDQNVIIPDLLQHLCLGEGLAVGGSNIDVLLQFFRDAGIDSIRNKAFHNDHISFR